MKLLLSLLVLVNILILNVLAQHGDHHHSDVHFTQFLIQGNGCSAGGELLHVNECFSNVCGVSGALFSEVDYVHMEYLLSLTNDTSCKNTNLSTVFECSDENVAVSLGNGYSVTCYDDEYVVPKYTKFQISGPGCSNDGETISNVDECSTICGSNNKVVEKTETSFNTFSLNSYSDATTTKTCSTLKNSQDFICLPDSQKVSVGNYSIICESSSSLVSASIFVTVLILSIVLLI
ncbi:hypothetical protein DDB_G0271702 [Dictyostelium discoideum AX4]|uniref:Uncharacterized protein n=1 Tax=Dictyostelium discoideum TaxID=44689 RepID=Q75JB7_DICDI|nr:hypothetical protein DDB_G0271702 [Dictyostelium discoideum AX4]EAL71541.1 hypothetical protein DDB_G0271702 [Dictyostelium discoideum AX4]|eukprot:XP_645458.1 hypothetical protein DDB_G0271702 [Dictyostelium discoideum AX4]